MGDSGKQKEGAGQSVVPVPAPLTGALPVAFPAPTPAP
jgi:hypothetical protein